MRVAAVDIGTNAVRLLVADSLRSHPSGCERLEWRDRRITITQLGQGVDASGRLADDAIGRTMTVLAEYAEVIRSWEVDTVRAIATAATRDAGNCDAFLQRVHRVLGTAPEVISGLEEAKLVFRGATDGLSLDRPVLVIDLGGGSTEFAQGSDELEYAASVNIGSVRLTERYLARLPAQLTEIEAAREAADEVFAAVDLPRNPAAVVGVAGTFTTLAAVALGLCSYDAAAVDGAVLSLAAIGGVVETFGSMTIDEIAAVPAMDPARAPVILGGAIAAERAIAVVGVDQVTVSESDILDGVALSIPRSR